MLQFWPNTDSHDDYVQKIFPLAEANREKAAKRADEKGGSADVPLRKSTSKLLQTLKIKNVAKTPLKGSMW